MQAAVIGPFANLVTEWLDLSDRPPQDAAKVITSSVAMIRFMSRSVPRRPFMDRHFHYFGAYYVARPMRIQSA